MTKGIDLRQKRRFRLTMKRFMRELYRDLCSLEDKRLLARVSVLFCCVKRFSDVKEWRWENVKKEKSGGVVVIMPCSKTDQIGVGKEWRIPAGKKGVTGPAEILPW